MKELKFYEYNQNNSGGGFDVDDNVCHRLFIQASDGQEADSIAESLGVYFDGCADGMDCDCCGDRWSSAWGDGITEYDLVKFEKGYRVKEGTFKTIEDYAQYLANQYGSTTPDVRIFKKHKEVIEIFTQEKK